MSENRKVQSIRRQVASLSLSELQSRLTQCVFGMEARLEEGAALVAEIEAKGGTPKCAAGLLTILRKIAANELLVDVVVRFGGRGHTFDSLKALPVDEQAAILKDDDDEIEKRFQRPRTERPEAVTVESAVARCVETIKASDDPAEAAELLMPKLLRLMKRRKAAVA